MLQLFPVLTHICGSSMIRIPKLFFLQLCVQYTREDQQELTVFIFIWISRKMDTTTAVT